MITPRTIKWEKRAIPILLFLWTWKLSTTAAIAAKFFPENKLHSVYKLLLALKKKGLIGYKYEEYYENFFWVLTDKGFDRISGKLPYDLFEEGYGSESFSHDFITTAAHLGDWLLKIPEGCDLFTEQQLRRIVSDQYPSWVPQCKFAQTAKSYHRPDGYWKINSESTKEVVALEVERRQQGNERYLAIGRFYASQESLYRVFWLVPSETKGRNISVKMQKHLKENEDYHNFILIDDFLKNGWRAKVFMGPDQNQTITNILSSGKGETMGERGETSPCTLLLDTRKNPITPINSII